jgi:hypothetical protein
MWLSLCDQSIALNSLSALISGDESREGGNSRRNHSIYNAFTFFDLDEVTELPSELFRDVEVVTGVSCVNKLFVKDVCEYPRVVDY